SSNRFRFNGVPVTRDIMEGLRSFLLDFHGQHELTGLFQKSVQRDFLDGLGGGELQTLKQSVSSCYSRWQQAKKAYQENQTAQQAFEAQRDFLQFQCNELEGAELKDPDEDVTLQSTLDRLTHLERLQGFTQQSIQWLVEGEWEKTPAISDALGKVQKALGEAARLDASLMPFTEEVTRLVEDTKAIANALSHYHESLEGNPQALSHLVDRLDQLEKLKRKYGPTLPEVLATFEKIQETLATQDQFQNQLESLKATVDLEETVLSRLCIELTQKREALAIELASSLVKELQALSMPKVQFQVTITPKALGADGKDDIGFLFSANPGEDLRPLAKVASGGELSRVLFGLKVLTAGSTTLDTGSSTLLFDEIDTGMSGMALRSVGERLRLLSQSRQVFVITHQPLVAAMGD
ncbi:MAG: AAA family ATPase, partial [Cyanobacteria bacterium]|nr:AAA family ATPase [Cyanobacteriota bacterium]